MVQSSLICQRATWNVPVESLEVVEAAPDNISQLPEPSEDHSLVSSKNVANLVIESKTKAGSGVKKEVALKIISKKKLKGNEANVWGEMEVLKDLNHPNIVSSNVTDAGWEPAYHGVLSGQIL
jgi:calcium/calmodulin-dependent protein kinase I